MKTFATFKDANTLNPFPNKHKIFAVFEPFFTTTDTFNPTITHKYLISLFLKHFTNLQTNPVSILI